MQPRHIEYTNKKPHWGHTCLRCYDRDENGMESFLYACECGHTWTQIKPTRSWHCGALNCPHLPRRIRQKLIPKGPGRPRNVSPIEEALSDGDGVSTSVYRRRITFGLDFAQRDRFEEICTLLHISMSRALQEMVSDWCDANAPGAYAHAVKYNRNIAKFRNYRSARQVADDLERDNWSDEVKAAVAATKRKTFNQLLQVDVDYTGKQSPYGN